LANPQQTTLNFLRAKHELYKIPHLCQAVCCKNTTKNP